MKKDVNASIVFITGKGGVGKTTLTASMSLSSASNKPVLCIAIDQPEMLGTVLGTEEISSHVPHKIADNFWVVHLDRQRCLNEFINEIIPIKSLKNKILGSPVYDYISSILPGIREFLILNRIRVLAEERDKWQTIFVDLPSSGHSRSLFSINDYPTGLFSFKPLSSRIKKTRDILFKSANTHFKLVTLPEGMPIEETLEFYNHLKKHGIADIEILLNRSQFNFLTQDEQIELEQLHHLSIQNIALLNLQNHTEQMKFCLDNFFSKIEHESELISYFIKKLKDSVDCPIRIIPLLPTCLPSRMAKELSRKRWNVL